MKRYCLLLCILLTAFSSGCSNIEDIVKQKALERSGIINEESYINYQNSIASGNIDEEGYYKEKEDSNNKGSIHVTFAVNNNLDIKYYKDSACNVPIDIDSCYLMPGDIIYAKVSISPDVFSTMYEFAEFKIYEYLIDGKRILSERLKSSGSNSEVVLQIPEDYAGTEIAIEPIGKYQERVISLKDYYIDKNDELYMLDGVWTVNDTEYTSEMVEISPISPYIISYGYDNKEYFFVSSEPECYYYNNDDGIVIFNQREATDETEDYSVELHKYLTVSIVSEADRTVRINEQEERKVKVNTELEISKLKYGDKVIIETDKEWTTLETYRDLILTNTEQLSDEIYKYKYTLIVPEKGGEFIFDPSEYVYEHGTIIFKCFGSVVSNVQYLAKGSKIYYEQNTADEGYWLSGTENYIVVGEEDETRQQLEHIHFTQKVPVSLRLKQPEYGGKIVYYDNGEEIIEENHTTYSGTEITMDFKAWEGWICNEEDNSSYIVNDNNLQMININGKDIEKIFVEDEEHKPELTVTLEKSVGEKASFDISASGISDTYTYKKTGLFRNNDIVIKKQKIGTERGINISIKDKSIPTGKAIKVDIKKEPGNKRNTICREIRYIDDPRDLNKTIYIYEDSEIEDCDVWYESIDITISIVDVMQFISPEATSNTTVYVKRVDDGKELNKDDLIEKDQKVCITILPRNGYYIFGGNASNEMSYQETLGYTKYLSKVENLISNHTAGKICEVILDASDRYAAYTYKCDGQIQPVGKKIQIKEGKKLKLEYKITDTEYKIKGASGSLFGLGTSDKEIVKDIIITSDMDGAVITKIEFGIETLKGE